MLSNHQVMATETSLFASKGVGRWGTRGQDQSRQERGQWLLLASGHLGFHKYRLPLLRGHQSPLLLLLEVFLLGQQYFLGVHTRL